MASDQNSQPDVVSAGESRDAVEQGLGAAKQSAARNDTVRHSGADAAAEQAEDLYGRARAVTQRTISSGSEMATGAMTRGSRQVRRSVSKQPIEALLLAGAIGYLVGWATIRS